MVWEPGKITFKVDGKEMGSFNEHIPADFDHGGMNNTIGVMNNNPNTSITVSHIDFTPLGSAPAAVATPVAAAAASIDVGALAVDASVGASLGLADATHDGVVDWNALAAIVTANYEATGHWFI